MGTRVLTRALLIFSLAVAAALFSPAAEAANCTCYLDGDCGNNEHCNWADACTRHCEIQDPWDPSWGAPPTSTADCDSYSGQCHDNLPQPPQGTDGNGKTCEPPTAPKPGGGTVGFKIRDGKCATKTCAEEPIPVDEYRAEAVDGINELVWLFLAGGDRPLEFGTDPDTAVILGSLAFLTLGNDAHAPLEPGGPRWLRAVDHPCAIEAIISLSDAFLAELDALSSDGRSAPIAFIGTPADDREHHEGYSFEPEPTRRGDWAGALLRTSLSAECRSWVQIQPHNCQFPHPAAHGHPFLYDDGIHCIAEQIAAMAASVRPCIGVNQTG